MATFPNKPAAGYTVNTGHAKCPNHLYMLDEGGTETNLEDKVGALDLTLNSTTAWATADLGGGGPASSAILTFVNDTADSAASYTWDNASGSRSACIVAIIKRAAVSSSESMGGLRASANNTDFCDLRLNATGQCTAIYDDSGIAAIGDYGAEVDNDAWRMVAAKFRESGGNIYVTQSIDGGAWSGETSAAGSFIATINKISLGALDGSSPGSYFNGSMASMFVYKDNVASWDDTWIASLYADPWQFLTVTTATTYVKLLAEASAASAASIEGVVLNSTRDTVIGEFTGQTFEASLEGGEAVLLIDVADITPNGSTLTTSDTPIVFAYNATDSIIGPGSATVVEL